ncbi:MAG: acetate--CoA ligase family protein [Candidatus Marinimicrobia bacterium]|nr:acetate--CoA ligase family protein [Candidatus Neomarinimicrobiota bacterium]
MSVIKPDIKYLFEPRSVAVIGVSQEPGKIGYKILENMVEVGYQGKIYAVNPKGGQALGFDFLKRVEDIDGEVDVAVIAIPARFVYDTVVACAKKKIPILTIISSGFSEVGNLEEEQRVVNYAKAHNMRILGPNIFGHYSSKVSLNATFGPRDITPGNVAIITQSGALGIAMIGKTAVQNIGLSSIISVGNKTDINESDLLEYLVEQDETKIILMYVEGIQEGERLVSVLKKATRKKPVIVIKSGRSKRGAVAAASHTGSLAGSDKVFDAIMKQCGVLRAESIQEALEWSKYLSHTPVPQGPNTIIITNGGGVGVMATDACEKYDIKLYDDQEKLKETFESVAHGFGSTKNPVDITGEASKADYLKALKEALADDDIQSVIALYCETAMMNSQELTEMIDEMYGQYQAKQKPITFSVFGGEKTEAAISALHRKNVPVYRDVYDGVSCLGALHFIRIAQQIESSIPAVSEIDVERINQIIDQALGDGRTFLLAEEGQSLLSACQIPGPKGGVVQSVRAAVKLATEIGFPVVMKVVSRDILHKSDAGGVLLNLDNEEEVIDGYQAIIHSCKANVPDAVIDGIEVVEQIQAGTEVILGGRRDASFGPTLMFGLGGIYVEVMKDVAFRAVPLSENDIRAMIKEIRSYPLLLGVRGELRKDIDTIVTTLEIVSTLITSVPRITDIEINPMVVYEQGQGARAVDIRVIISDDKEDLK